MIRRLDEPKAMAAIAKLAFAKRTDLRFHDAGDAHPRGGRDQHGGGQQARLGERGERQPEKDRREAQHDIDKPHQHRAQRTGVETRESPAAAGSPALPDYGKEPAALAYQFCYTGFLQRTRELTRV
jgi:hypothetical protein